MTTCLTNANIKTRPRMARETQRKKIRMLTQMYRRSPRDLDNILECVSFPDRIFAAAGMADPMNPAVTKMICRALYRRMKYCRVQGVRMLPAYTSAREYFACECATYAKQMASLKTIPHHLFKNVISIN